MTVAYAFGAAKNPDHVLEQAKGEFEQVVVIGIYSDGYVDTRASLNMSARDVLWAMEQSKLTVLANDVKVGE